MPHLQGCGSYKQDGCQLRVDTLSELETLVLSEVFTITRRAADWWQVMEGIYGSETEADEERPPEEGEEKPEDKDA